MSTEYLRDIISAVGSSEASIVADAKSSSEFSGTVDSGCYVFNALLSGSIFGGMQDNKITAIAGASATGKTFLALGLIKNFLDADPNSCVLYYDTEAAVTSKMMSDRGIDTKRVAIIETDTIEKFRTSVSKVVEAHMQRKSDTKMLIVLDSLGMLSTEKETTDIHEGNNKRDMTRSQLIRGTFRALSLKLAKARIPMLITNHTYAAVGAMVPTEEVSGGGGLKYAASTIITLTKAQDKAGTELVGGFIRMKLFKSRFTREGQFVRARLSHQTGLDKYYGLLELAVEMGVLEQQGPRVEIDGKKYYAKHVYQEPEKFFTQELLEKIDAAAARKFCYGQHEEEIGVDEDMDGGVLSDDGGEYS